MTSEAGSYVWCLTDAKINELQVASIERLIARCGQASWANVQVQLRINGGFETVEADWIKHLKRVTEPADHAQLMAFYAVKDKDELIDRLYHHIDRLQAKLPPNNQPERTHVREG